MLGVLVAGLVALETAWSDVARYAVYAVWSVLLPGTLVYRALRRIPHSLVDDLAMGAATGLVLELIAFTAFSASGLRDVLWLWPVLVVVPFVAVRPLRRHWRPKGFTPAPLGWCWSVAVTAIFMLGYLGFAFLRPNQPVPTSPRLYFIDQLYQLSLVGEAKHHFPLQTPQVAGEPLTYHWFTFAHMAAASMISGVDTTVVFFRLALPAICLLAVVLLAVVGWRVTGRPWVGAVASALGIVVGELAIGTHSISSLGGVTAYMVWASESVPYGWLMTFPLIPLILDRLVGGLREAPIGRGAWVGLSLFALAASGAKASVLPVVLCAVGMVALVELVRRRPRRATWAVLGILLTALVFAVVVLFRFEAQGMTLRPLGILRPFAASDHGRAGWKIAAVYAFLFVAYCLFMFTRLAGIPVLAWLRRREWGTVEWFLLGGLVGGALATLLLNHSLYGQNYFIRSGFAFGAILSAAGMVALVEKYRVSARAMVLIAVAAAVVAAVPSLLIWHPVYDSGAPGVRGVLPIYYGAAVPALVVAGLLLARRFRPRTAGVATVAALAVALGAGLPTLPWDARMYPNANTYYHSALTPQGVAGARWLREHSDPEDIVATNAHCVTEVTDPCWNMSFWMSAYTERRFLVEGWGYAPRTSRAGAEQKKWVGSIPFWDPDLLALNDAAFSAPDQPTLAALWNRGVRWLLVDRRFGTESPALREQADLVHESGSVVVYHLNLSR